MNRVIAAPIYQALSAGWYAWVVVASVARLLPLRVEVEWEARWCEFARYWKAKHRDQRAALVGD